MKDKEDKLNERYQLLEYGSKEFNDMCLEKFGGIPDKRTKNKMKKWKN